MAFPKGKSLTPEQNARVREAVRALLPRYDDNITALARPLGITQAGLSSFLSARTGAGFQLAGSVAQLLGVSLDVLINGTETLPDRVATQEPRNQNLANWPAAERAALARGVVPAWSIQVARRHSTWARLTRSPRPCTSARGCPWTSPAR